jgi:hypothetical protein
VAPSGRYGRGQQLALGLGSDDGKSFMPRSQATTAT